MWWKKDNSQLTYCSYKVNNTEVMIGPRLDSSHRGCSEDFFNSVNAWLVVTESYVEYPISANVRWFPWKEGMEPLPDHVVYGSLKMLNYWINNLELPRVYIHCDLGTHRAPSVFGAFLKSYYSETQNLIVENRKLFNKKQSTIVSGSGKIMADPIEYFESYVREVKLMDTMISSIVKYPHLSLAGIVDVTFQDRPLALYTQEELAEYEIELAEKNKNKEIRAWLISKKFDIPLDSNYVSFSEVQTPNGICNIIGDVFRPDIYKSIKKHGKVYLLNKDAVEYLLRAQSDVKLVHQESEGNFNLFYLEGQLKEEII